MNLVLRIAGAAVVLMLSAQPVIADEYPCPAWPPAESAFWKPMAYRLIPTPKGSVVVAEGQIKAGESQRIKAQVQRAIAQPGGIHEIWLNSPGGDSEEGQAMGRVIRGLGVPTRIRSGAFCVSACSVAFLGGVFRAVESGGAYTVHMFSNFSGYEAHQALQNTVKDLQSLEQDSAQYAAERYQYLLEMGISPSVAKHGFSVKNQAASCPPRAVLKQWNVDNSP
jgi:hypothetical protein